MIRHVRKTTSGNRIPISVEIEVPATVREAVFQEDVDFFFVSKDYAKWKGARSHTESLEKVLPMIPVETRKTVLICAWGDTGARAAVIESSKIARQVSSPSFPPRSGLVDTTGAGDSFIAATIFALMVLQQDLEQAIAFGCRFAGAKCGTLGNQGLDNFEQLI